MQDTLLRNDLYRFRCNYLPPIRRKRVYKLKIAEVISGLQIKLCLDLIPCFYGAILIIKLIDSGRIWQNLEKIRLT